jgi:hypothetical protein
MQKPRLCLCLPIPLCEQIHPDRIADIVETFDWNLLPSDIDTSYTPKRDGRARLYCSVTTDAEQRLRDYCATQNKWLNQAIVQALIYLKEYQPGATTEYRLSPLYPKASPRLSANPTVRTNFLGWFVVEYPNNESAILVLRTVAERRKFLKDCGADSIAEVTEIPTHYYRLATLKCPT